MIYFDVEKLRRKYKERGLGSASLATRAGVRNDDVQDILWRGHADDEIGKKIIDVLGEDVLEDSLKNDDEEEENYADLDTKIDPSTEIMIADYSIKQVKEKIGNGEIELAEALELEKAQENPRITLLKWIEEQLEE